RRPCAAGSRTGRARIAMPARPRMCATSSRTRCWTRGWPASGGRAWRSRRWSRSCATPTPARSTTPRRRRAASATSRAARTSRLSATRGRRRATPPRPRTSTRCAAGAGSGVGAVGACAGVAALGAAVPPPRAPAAARDVDALRGDLAHLSALRLLGKYREGLAARGDVVARARALGHAPVVAAALDLAETFEVAAGSYDAAVDLGYEAARGAARAHDDGLAGRE